MSAYISEKKIKQLELKANEIRQSIIAMLVAAGSGHTAGPLGMADIFTALYFHVLHHDSRASRDARSRSPDTLKRAYRPSAICDHGACRVLPC